MNGPGVSPDVVEAHLDKVLGSVTFRGAERSRRLLRFIVEQTLQGRAESLKDYTLGAEALGRGNEFDPRTDPIARVEMSRLRSRLDVYYATDGASDEMRIVVPKGGYIPLFERRSTAPDTSPAGSGPQTAAGTAGPADLASSAWRWSTVWLALTAAVVAAAGTWWLAHREGRPGDRAVAWLELTTPPTTDAASLALSPDGRTVVFVASAGDVPRLWTRTLADARARSLAGTEHASFPFWKPDGRAIGFFAEGRVKAIDLQTRMVRTLSAAPVPAGAAWSRDGVILHPLVPDGPLFQTTGDGRPLARATQLAAGQTGHRGPAFLPDGRRFLFYAAGRGDARGIYVGELGTPHLRRLLDADSAAVFVPPHHLLYTQNGTLFAHGFDPETATVRGGPSAVMEHVEADSSSGLAAVSASSSGTIAYRTGPIGQLRQFVWYDRAGKELARIGVPEERGPSYGSISPDGRRLAVQRTLDDGNTDIWLVDLERGPSVRFTSDPQPDIAPIWSPRGDRIAYASQVDGVFDLFDKPLDGGERRLLLHTGEVKQMTDWSRDGREALYRSVRTTPSADMDVWMVAFDGKGAPVAVVRTPFEERDAQFSPDGTWIAYQSNDSGRHEVYVQPLKGGRERLRISAAGGVQARWRADGRELFYLTPEGQLTGVPIESVDGGRSLRPGAAVPLFRTQLGAIHGIALHSYVVAPDGERFLLDVVVERQAPPLTLVLNWTPPGG